VPSRKPEISIRRPSSAPAPGDIERFVSGQGGGQVPSPPGTATPATAKAKGIHVRKDGRVRRRITAYLPPELAQHLALHAVATGREVSDVVAAAVSAYLTSGGR
jgi:hypothetical protein